MRPPNRLWAEVGQNMEGKLFYTQIFLFPYPRIGMIKERIELVIP